MLRKLVLLSVVAGVLVGLALAGGLSAGTVAQEPTPAAGDPTFSEGVAAEQLTEARVAELPAAPAAFRLVRYRLEPGASLPAESDDPSLAIVYVEEGTLAARVDAPVTISSGPRLGTPLAEVVPGVEFQLEPGESFAFPPFAGGGIRNDGRRPAVILAAVIDPDAGAQTPGAGGSATPTVDEATATAPADPTDEATPTP